MAMFPLDVTFKESLALMVVVEGHNTDDYSLRMMNAQQRVFRSEILDCIVGRFDKENNLLLSLLSLICKYMKLSGNRNIVSQSFVKTHLVFTSFYSEVK